MRFVLGLAALLLLAPTAAACEGLSPGDELLTEDGRCTLAFLLANPEGLWFATAGHCIRPGQAASNPDAGDFGVGAMRHLVPDTGQATDGEPGEDFGLIRVDPSFHDKVNPKVCAWDGPTGIVADDGADGGKVRHHGYGTLLGENGLTRAREGYNLYNDGNVAFYWTGAGVPGDSGSAVLSEDGRALGVLTHLGVMPGPGETNGGTHLLRGLALAEENGIRGLRLVLAGEDPVEVLRSLQGAAPPGGADDDAPSGNATNGTAPPTSATPPADDGADGGNETDGADGNGTAPSGDGDALETARAEKPESATPGPGAALALAAALVAALRRRRA